MWAYVTEHIVDSPSAFLIGHGTHSDLREILGYPAHNIYLQAWYDTGIIGLSTSLFFIIMSIRSLFSEGKRLTDIQCMALVGYFSLILNDAFGTVNTEAIAIWDYVILGIILSAPDFCIVTQHRIKIKFKKNT